MNFVPRNRWGARVPRYINNGSLSAESTEHWNGPTVTVGGRTTWDHSRCAGLVRGIQNFHMDGKGWSDIAYNFLVCPHGYVFEGRGLNVINGANGTNSGNRSSHAICSLAGGGNRFTEEEKQGIKACVRHISDQTLAPSTCKGHRDHKSTECPGNERYTWVHQGMPTSGSLPHVPNPLPIPPNTDLGDFLMGLSNEQQTEILEAIRDLRPTLIRRSGTSYADSVCILLRSTYEKIPLKNMDEIEDFKKQFNMKTNVIELPSWKYNLYKTRSR